MTRKKSLSKVLSRRDPTEAEFDAAIAEFHNGSDRVAAIMGAALLENHLIFAISAALEDNADVASLFYNQGSPFGTLSAKIVAAKAMGIVTKEIADDIDQIREIRNQFAHALLALDFENQHIVEACNLIGNHTFRRDKRTPVTSVSRERFEVACWSIAFTLILKENELTKAKFDKKTNDLMGETTSNPSPL